MENFISSRSVVRVLGDIGSNLSKAVLDTLEQRLLNKELYSSRLPDKPFAATRTA